MKSNSGRKISLSLALAMVLGVSPLASAAAGDLGVGSTALGKIIVNGKGMTAYYYQLDTPNSGVSTCTGGCLIHWPAITSAAAIPQVVGITAKISIIPSTKQILVDGRPIYTYAGDQKVGDTNGQGIGGIWYAISPSGVELNAAGLVKEKSSPRPTTTHSKSGAKPKVKASHKPNPKKTPTNSYYGR